MWLTHDDGLRGNYTSLLCWGSKFACFFFTHLYELAGASFQKKSDGAMFLRDREPFRLLEGQPLETSYGEDFFATVRQPHLH